MGAYLNTPVREKESVDDDTSTLKYGASSMQGWRMAQEDAHNCCPEFDRDSHTALFAVYDGHGGSEVAQYAAARLPEFIRNHKLYKEMKIADALPEIFLDFDELLTHGSVIDELKKLAGVDEQPRHEDSDDEETEAAMLFEEADMPIEQLMERYGGSAGPPKAAEIRQLRKKENIQSPAIRPKQAGPNLGTPEDSGDDEVKMTLEDKLVNGCSQNGKSKQDCDLDNASSSFTSDTDADSQGNKTTVTVKPDVSSSTNETLVPKKAEKSDSDGVSSTADVSEAAGNSGDSCKTISCSSDDAVVSSSDGSSADSGSVSAQASSQASEQAGSSSGRTRKQRKNIIPAEGEDESSFDEDEEDTEDEEDSDEEGLAWYSGDDDSEEDEDENVVEGFPPKFIEDDDEDDDEGDDEGVEIMGGGDEPGSDSGCTAVVAVLRGCELHVANAGDSRCVVCRNGKAIDMSFDHKPEDTVELERIKKAGGKVTADGRVNGGLNLSRALGDHCYKQNKSLPLREQMISALPDIKTLTLEDADEFMVLACDGIWNVMSSQDVVSFVRDRIRTSTKISAICEEMFEFCLAPDTMGDGTGCDNMTCIIVALDKLMHQNNGSQDEDVTAAVKKRRADSSSADSEGWDQPDSKRSRLQDDNADEANTEKSREQCASPSKDASEDQSISTSTEGDGVS